MGRTNGPAARSICLRNDVYRRGHGRSCKRSVLFRTRATIRPCLSSNCWRSVVFRVFMLRTRRALHMLPGVTMMLMKKWLVLVTAGGLCLAADPPVTLTGVVGDDMCSGDHKRMGGTDAMKCTRECVNDMHAKYALIVGADVYEFADQKAAARYIGRKVTVKGNVTSTTEGKVTTKSLQAKSISAAR
jgi:hypothetical protein